MRSYLGAIALTCCVTVTGHQVLSSRVSTSALAQELHPVKTRSPEDLETATTLSAEGMALYQREQYDEAIDVFERVLSIHENSLGADHPEVAATLNNLATLYQTQAQYNRAEELFERSLSIKEKVFGAEHPEVALSLNNLAFLYDSLSQFERAKHLYQRSLTIRETVLGKEHLDVSNSLNNLAGIYESLGDYDRAESLYLRGLKIREKHLPEHHPDIATFVNNLGYLYARLARYDRAESYFLRSIEMYEAALGNDSTDVALSLNNLATLYENTGEYSKADPLYQRSLSIWQAVFGDRHPQVALALNNAASLALKRGHYDRAESLYQKSLDIHKEFVGEDSIEVARTLGNLAAMYAEWGHYDRAESHFQSSLNISKQVLGDRHPDVATQVANLAFFYHDLGQYDRAIDAYIESHDIRVETFGYEHPDIALSLNNLAEFYRDRGQYERAETMYLESIGIVERTLGSEHPALATTFHNLGALYDTVGEYERALPLYRRSLTMRETIFGSDHPSVASSLNNLAGLQRTWGHYERAAQMYERSASIWRATFGSQHPNVADSLSNVAWVYHLQGKTEKALDRLTRSLETEERDLAANLFRGSERDKYDYLGLFEGSTNAAVSFHLQHAPTSDRAARLALTTLLRRKGRILDVLGESMTQLRQRMTSSDREVLDSLTDLYQQMANLTASSQLDSDDHLVELANEAEKLQRQLLERNVHFRREVEPVTIDAVRAAMPDRAALIEFIQYRPLDPTAVAVNRLGEPRYAAYILHADGAIAWVDLGDAAELNTLIGLYHVNINRSWEAYSQQLYAKAFEPLQEHLDSVELLLVAPDSALNVLPLGALLDRNRSFLLETYSMTYLTSGRDLLRMQPSNIPTRSPLLFANPAFDADKPKATHPLRRSHRRSGRLDGIEYGSLPFAEAEAKAIAPLFPNLETFVGTEATENRLKQARSPQFLHLATHGFFEGDRSVLTPETEENSEPDASDRDPVTSAIENPLLLSGLALAGFNDRQSGTEDGVLTALEVTGLDLRGTELVVLSACETGLGQVAQGEGVYGLRRAFTLAGAQSQLMSLWNVDDESTRVLVETYYQNLTRGEGRSEALRQAQLKMMRDPYWESPYFWAAFVPTGNWRPLSVLSSSESNSEFENNE